MEYLFKFRRPCLLFVNEGKNCHHVDSVVPANQRMKVKVKESERLEKYLDLV